MNFMKMKNFKKLEVLTFVSATDMLLRREKIIINPYIRFPIKILNRDNKYTQNKRNDNIKPNEIYEPKQ